MSSEGDSAKPAATTMTTTTTAETGTSSPSKKRKSLEEIEVDLDLPEPPSKKARRALKKGKPLPVKPSSDDDDNDNGDDTDADERGDGEGGGGDKTKNKSSSNNKKKDRSPHAVWIGNLPFTLTRSELRAWLVDNSGGAIAADHITRVHMRPGRDSGKDAAAGRRAGSGPAPATNKGFAYVDFSAAEHAVAALALSETLLGGRPLLIKDAKSFDGRPKKIEAASADAGGEGAATTTTTTAAAAAAAAAATGNRKIFVGNLPFAATEDDLRDLFGRCGDIDWVKVATFEDSGKCKGYGWVKFATPDAAASAARGFVRIREDVETEEDFMDPREDGGDEEKEDNDDSDDGSEDQQENRDAVGDHQAPPARKRTAKKEGGGERQFKMRKWWVNRLHGRDLKVQMAEEDQVRYKRRFGKDAPARKTASGQQQQQQQQQQEQQQQQQRLGKDREQQRRPNGGMNRRKFKGNEEAESQELPTVAQGEAPKNKAISYHNDIKVARLTGAAVAPQGIKKTFD